MHRVGALSHGAPGDVPGSTWQPAPTNTTNPMYQITNKSHSAWLVNISHYTWYILNPMNIMALRTINHIRHTERMALTFVSSLYLVLFKANDSLRHISYDITTIFYTFFFAHDPWYRRDKTNFSFCQTSRWSPLISALRSDLGPASSEEQFETYLRSFCAPKSAFVSYSELMHII